MRLDRLILWGVPLLILAGFASRLAWYQSPAQLRVVYEMRSAIDGRHFWVLIGEHFEPDTRFGIYPHGQTRDVPAGYTKMDALDRDNGRGVQMLPWQWESSGVAVIPIPDDVKPGLYDVAVYERGERLQVGDGWATNTPVGQVQPPLTAAR